MEQLALRQCAMESWQTVRLFAVEEATALNQTLVCAHQTGQEVIAKFQYALIFQQTTLQCAVQTVHV